MAIKLERKTPNAKQLKLVSVFDDAIDWDRSCLDEVPSIVPTDADGNPSPGFQADDKSMEEARNRRRLAYLKSHKLDTLVFLPDTTPTVFVFDHPHRVDVSSKVRVIQTALQKRDADIITDVWQGCFLGTEEGLDGAPLVMATRRDGRLTADIVQALEDQGVFEELGTAYMAYVMTAERPGVQAKLEISKKK